MEMSQGSSMYSLLKQTKLPFFFFIYEIREQKGEIGPAWLGWYQCQGRVGEKREWKGEYSANIGYT
jgi:hypothetical protein